MDIHAIIQGHNHLAHAEKTAEIKKKGWARQNGSRGSLMICHERQSKIRRNMTTKTISAIFMMSPDPILEIKRN